MWLIKPITAQIPEIIDRICIFCISGTHTASNSQYDSIVNVYLNVINLSGIAVP